MDHAPPPSSESASMKSRRRVFIIVAACLVAILVALAALSRMWNPTQNPDLMAPLGICTDEAGGSTGCTGKGNTLPLYDSLQDVDPSLTDIAFLELVFGKDNPQWKMSVEEEAAIGTDAKDGHLIKSTVWTALPLQGTYKGKILVLMRVGGESTCPSCGDRIDAFVIQKAETGWTIVQKVERFLSVSALEDAEEQLEGVQLGPQNAGIQVTSSSTTQGYTIRSYSLISVVESKPSLVFVLKDGDQAPDGFDVSQNGAYSPTWSYESEVTFEPGKNPEWYDISVRTEGTFGTTTIDDNDRMRWQANLKKEADPVLRAEPGSSSEADSKANLNPPDLDEELPDAKDPSFKKNVKVITVDYTRRFMFNGKSYIPMN